MLNWIVWNRIVYLYKYGFDIKEPTKVDMPNKQTNFYNLEMLLFNNF